MRDTVIGLAASLTAAISLLEKSYAEKKPANKIAASDRMFRQMLEDYNNALAAWRNEQSKYSDTSRALISDLELSVRLANILKNKFGDVPISELFDIADHDFLLIPGMTKKALRELREVLGNVA